jgi:hypothetical protein
MAGVVADGLTRVLVIVARDRADVLEAVKRQIAGIPNVEVVIDRRSVERRRSQSGSTSDRRVSDRRARSSRRDLQSLGFTFAALRDAAHTASPARGSRSAAPSGDVAEFLRSVPLFKGLSAADLQMIGERVTDRALRKNEILFHEGEEGQEMFFVRRGSVVISKEVVGRVEKVLTVMEPGDFFGEMSLFGLSRRSATVRAQTAARVLALDRSTLEELIHASPSAGLAFFSAMVHEFSGRLGRTDDLVTEVTRWGLEATGLELDEDSTPDRS